MIRYTASEIVEIVCLPVFCFLFERYFLRMFDEKEQRPIVHGKVIAWVCLGGAIGLTYTTNSLLLMMSCAGMLFGYSIFYMSYSMTLFYYHYSIKNII